MNNIDNFKLFVKNNPSLLTYVTSGTMSWQAFYELYDLYGEDNSVWSKYLVKEEKKEETSSKKNTSLASIMDMAKNIDADKLQNSINSIQKAISMFGDMLTKNNSDSTSSYSPRPIYRKFDD